MNDHFFYLNFTSSLIKDSMLKPQLFSSLKGYDKKHFFSDITAGLIVGIVALPLAIAFAIASGVAPEKGLITAIIGGLILRQSVGRTLCRATRTAPIPMPL